MNQPALFSSGLELSALVTSSALLCRSWAVIGDLHARVDSSSFSVEYKVQKESDLTIIAFEANQQLLKADLVSSSDPSIPPHFNFLCSESNPSFSVNKSAIELFCSLAQPHDDQLNLLKSKIDNSKPLIVTGHAFGGSIASLFTLWLLDAIDSSKKRPLCITFGSPLVGGQTLQQIISGSSTWNSCFLHLLYYRDSLPRSFISHPNYKLFGTILLCTEYGASCIEHSGSILEVLQILDSYIGNMSRDFPSDSYREIVEDLNRKAIYNEFTRVDNLIYSDPLKASIVLQLQAFGVQMQQHQQQDIGIKVLVQKMALECRRKKKFDPAEKLNSMKITMANLEWYKKVSKAHGGYYDSFKKMCFQHDMDVVQFKRELTYYWIDMVKEVKTKPQREGAAFRTRWLFAGTNYQRMVEPLDIAEYYRDGKKDYIFQGRSEHYKQLEKRLQEDSKNSEKPSSTEKRNVELILTLDSCFWAHVEEALILCQVIGRVQSSLEEKEDARMKLNGFENYVYESLEKYAVSPEIFLEDSSYMTWWKKYKAIMGSSHNQKLVEFMSCKDNFDKYATGTFDF